MQAENNVTLWKDRKRLWFGLPWTFTTYQLDGEKLYVKRGFFTVARDEVRLYRIKDISVNYPRPKGHGLVTAQSC